MQAELEDLRRRRQRWLDAFETGALDAAALGARSAELNDRISRVRAQLETLEAERSQAQSRRSARVEWASMGDTLPQIILSGDRQDVNARLRMIINHITVNKDHSVKIDWR